MHVYPQSAGGDAPSPRRAGRSHKTIIKTVKRSNRRAFLRILISSLCTCSCPSISGFLPVGGLVGLKSSASMGWEGCRTSWRRRQKDVAVERDTHLGGWRDKKYSVNLGILRTMIQDGVMVAEPEQSYLLYSHYHLHHCLIR